MKRELIPSWEELEAHKKTVPEINPAACIPKIKIPPPQAVDGGSLFSKNIYVPFILLIQVIDILETGREIRPEEGERVWKVRK